MSIADRILRVKSSLPGQVELVAVSKTYPAQRIMEAYEAGQRIFGENRPQEMAQKYEELPKDIEWHLIGHLQTNKVKMVVPFVAMIHSLDSVRLAEAIQKAAAAAGRTIDVLLEIHVADEESNRAGSGRNCRNTFAAAPLHGCPTCGCGVSWAWRPTPATSRSSGGISPLCNGIRASCRPISGRSSIPFRSECPTTTGSLSNTERRWCVSVR